MARRPTDPRAAAEAVFKPAAPSTERLKETSTAVPNAREMVSLRLDRDVLEHFQEEGPGWQDRINAALREAAGL
ncbi:BrnA antitoxin family protein [Aurantimonas sp. A2-1-M11]|uniref:BrnA antitoxin family protein n=1 Tax=Aurantimonas sp. A2-1-M11 TaxID=3113712 RepID=UPI002F9201C1